MATYKDANYRVLLFFSLIGIKSFEEQNRIIGSFFNHKEGLPALRYKGFLNGPSLEMRTIRQGKLDFNKLNDKLKSMIKPESESLLMYFFDKDWSDTNPPKVFLSEFLVSATFKGKNLCLDGNKVKSFYALGVRTDQNVSFCFNEFFINLRGVIGYEFDHVNYAYNGQTYLEWAHQNIPINIKSESVNEWNEPQAVRKYFCPPRSA